MPLSAAFAGSFRIILLLNIFCELYSVWFRDRSPKTKSVKVGCDYIRETNASQLNIFINKYMFY